MAEEIDSFTKAYRDYIVAKGTPDAEKALRVCLSIGEATFSELLAGTSGSEKQAVSDCCERLGMMVEYGV